MLGPLLIVRPHTEGFLPGMLGAGHGSALITFALPEE